MITGIDSGIGRVTAMLFAQEGTKVVGVDIDQENGLEVIEAIKCAGEEAAFVNADVSETRDVKKLVKRH